MSERVEINNTVLVAYALRELMYQNKAYLINANGTLTIEGQRLIGLDAKELLNIKRDTSVVTHLKVLQQYCIVSPYILVDEGSLLQLTLRAYEINRNKNVVSSDKNKVGILGIKLPTFWDKLTARLSGDYKEVERRTSKINVDAIISDPITDALLVIAYIKHNNLTTNDSGRSIRKHFRISERGDEKILFGGGGDYAY